MEGIELKEKIIENNNFSTNNVIIGNGANVGKNCNNCVVIGANQSIPNNSSYLINIGGKILQAEDKLTKENIKIIRETLEKIVE